MVDKIVFGTDGWRAIIGEDFNEASLARAVDAAARVFKEDHPEGGRLLVGYDCRLDAARYAELAARVAQARGLEVLLSDAYCPTPCLCWSISRDQQAIGGLMLTSSHNPAEWLGLKLRMEDGGASPKEFSDRVEAALEDEAPQVDNTARVTTVDLVGPYLEDLKGLVDGEAIRAAGLKVVVDPLFGAGRLYLAPVLESLGVEVCEIHNQADPSFQGLHPEPILPWVEEACGAVVKTGSAAAFITDGDADRIGAADENGAFVNPHRILTLMVRHLVEDKGMQGRVVTTVSGTNLLRRQCEKSGLEFVDTPVGFKWIYGEMLKGDVLIGGEESGGMGIPDHVRERDGLLMALMLVEMMAQRGRTLGELVQEMFDELGPVEYTRRDLRLTAEEKQAALDFMASYPEDLEQAVADFAPTGKIPETVDRRDGLKLTFQDGSWLLFRVSGTENLVRVYAESQDMDGVNALQDVGCALVQA